MQRPKPYGGTSLERLVALLNNVNGTAYLSGHDFTLSPPEYYTDPSGSNTRNTKITVYPDRSTNERLQDQEVHYWRLPISVIGNLPRTALRAVFIDKIPFTTHEMLDRINESLGINLVPEEVSDDVHSLQQTHYTLNINEAVSLAWTGNYEFRARHFGDPIELADALYEQSLTGFGFFQSYLDGYTVAEYRTNPDLTFTDLLNRNNPQLNPPLSEDNVTISLPTTHLDASFNSSVTLTSEPLGPYVGTASVFYNRLRLADVFQGLTLESYDFFDRATVIEELRAKADITLPDAVLATIAIPDMEYATDVDITISANPESYVWQGDALVTLSVAVPEVVIDDLHEIVHAILPGNGPYF